MKVHNILSGIWLRLKNILSSFSCIWRLLEPEWWLKEVRGGARGPDSSVTVWVTIIVFSSISLSLSVGDEGDLAAASLCLWLFSVVGLSGLLPVAGSICTHRHTRPCEAEYTLLLTGKQVGCSHRGSDLWREAVRDSRRWPKTEAWQTTLALRCLTMETTVPRTEPVAST